MSLALLAGGCGGTPATTPATGGPAPAPAARTPNAAPQTSSAELDARVSTPQRRQADAVCARYSAEAAAIGRAAGADRASQAAVTAIAAVNDDLRRAGLAVCAD